MTPGDRRHWKTDDTGRQTTSGRFWKTDDTWRTLDDGPDWVGPNSSELSLKGYESYFDYLCICRGISYLPRLANRVIETIVAQLIATAAGSLND